MKTPLCATPKAKRIRPPVISWTCWLIAFFPNLNVRKMLGESYNFESCSIEYVLFSKIKTKSVSYDFFDLFSLKFSFQ